MKEKKKEKRTEKSIIGIKLALLGAVNNLYLLENILYKIENISIYQYSNYLSQIALCVELGLKSIIINADDFEHEHNLEYLFSMTPEMFQKKFRSYWPDIEIFTTNMSNMKNIFIDFRYMKHKSTFKEYLDETILNSDGSINLKKATNLAEFQFLIMLREEILNYEGFIQEEFKNQSRNNNLTNVDITVSRYTEIVKNIQTSIK
jgi:hypothetical protein